LRKPILKPLITVVVLVLAFPCSSLAADLGSDERNIPAPAAGGPVAIRTGNGTRLVQPGEMLTAAELAALQQVVGGGRQMLNVDQAGRAVGGVVSLGALGQQVNSLVVPAGVTAFGGTLGNVLDVVGTLRNEGTLAAITQHGASSFVINADRLINGVGATITTAVPSQLASVVQAPVGKVDLDIVLKGDLINQGTISSTGNLNITTASGAIQNAGGVLSAMDGRMNIASAAPLRVLGGTLEAIETNVSANGKINVAVDQVIGKINVKGTQAHILARQGDLTIGDIDLSGDPTFVALGGDLLLSPNAPGGLLQFPGQDLAILAFGNVIADPTLAGIDLSSKTGNAGNLFISAGLIPTEINALAEHYGLGGPSVTGGSILIPNVDITTIADFTAAPGSKGGSVTLIARDNNSINEPLGSGRIEFRKIESASGVGRGGDILVVAQAGPLNIVGGIGAGGVGGGGKIELFGGGPVALDNMEFVGGTLVQGRVAIENDLGHEPVPVNVSPLAFFYYSGGTAAQQAEMLVIDSQGDVTLGSGFAIDTNRVFIRSRAGAVSSPGPMSIWTDLGLKVVSDGIGSNSNFGSISLFRSFNGNVEISSNGGDLSLGTMSNARADRGTVYLLASGSMNFADNVHMLSRDGTFLASGLDMNLGNDGQIFSLASNILVSLRDLNIGTGKVINSGSLSTSAPPTGLLIPGDFLEFGGTYLLAERDINLDSSITARGRDIAGIARTGQMNLGGGNTFTAHGGNIEFFAQGSLVGDNNTFTSRAVGENNDFNGGMIELSSGFTFNPFVLTTNAPNPNVDDVLKNQILSEATSIAQFINTPDTKFTAPLRDINGFILDPALVGANVNVNNNGVDVGLMKVTKLGGGQIDVSNSQFSFNKGAVFLEAIGATASVQMTNSQFSVESYGVIPFLFTDVDLPSVVQNALSNSSRPLAITTDLRMLDRSVTDFINQANGQQINLSVKLTNKLAESERDKQQSDFLSSVISNLAGRYSQNNGGNDSRIIDTGKTEVMQLGSISIGSSTSSSMNAATATTSHSNAPLTITNGPGTSTPVRVSESRSDLLLFTTAGQVMTNVGSGHHDIIGGRGTVVSATENKVVLHGGQIYANSGAQPLEIATSFGTVILPEGTSAAIVSEPGKESRVVALGGKNPNAKIVIKPRSAGETEIVIQPGEQATIEVNQVANASLTRAVIITEKADVRAIVQGETFASVGIRLGGTTRTAYQRLLENMAATSDTIIHAATAHAIELKDSERPSRLLAEDGTIFQQEGDNKLQLQHGSMFLEAQQNQTVRTAAFTVQVEGGGTAAVETNKRQTRVRSFGTGATRIATADQLMTLAAGQELLVQSTRPTKSDALPKDGIARRRLEQVQLSNGMHAVTGDFSIFSALSTSPALSPLRHPESVHDKKLNGALLKAAVAIDMATGKRGRYFVAPNATAFIQQDNLAMVVDGE
jgi:hypothetical protein